jgi:hypothetical protein
VVVDVSVLVLVPPLSFFEAAHPTAIKQRQAKRQANRDDRTTGEDDLWFTS